MSVNFKRGCSIAALTVFLAPNAWADVSPQDVWSEWKSYMESSGYEVKATESQKGDTLTITDISFDITIPDADGPLSMSMPNLDLVGNGDGSVNVTTPEEFQVTFALPANDETIKGVVAFRTDGAPIVVSGDPDDITTRYESEYNEFSILSIGSDKETLPADALKTAFVLKQVALTTHTKIGEQRDIKQEGSIGALTYDVSFKDPDNADNFGTFVGELKDMAYGFNSVLPLNYDAADVFAMLRSGAGFDGSFTFGNGQSKMGGKDGSDEFEATSSSQGGEFKFVLNDDTLIYDLTQNQSDISIFSSEIPLPIAFSAEQIGMKLQMPTAVTEEDKDFGFGITLKDFNVPETLWAMADPTGALPHDPASLVLDLTGKGRLLIDIFDPESAATAQLDDDTPALFNSVKVNDLLLRAAGAELTGTGDFELDNADLETYDGMPAPTGLANLKLVGANSLIDNLIKMGLMSESDAGGARLMMGLLAVPGEGKDTLTSEIKFETGGKIIANGQRIK